MRIRPRASESLSDDESSHYCAHCLAAVTATSQSCRSCDAPFTGAGSFDRLAGPPPSQEFAFLFEREAQPAARLAARPYQAFC
jgi:predicted amidophosphoribosyltransferase